MCRRINCRSCGKPTWTGCGHHISAVLAGVREEDRCKCGSKHSQPNNAQKTITAPTIHRPGQMPPRLPPNNNRGTRR